MFCNVGIVLTGGAMLGVLECGYCADRGAMSGFLECGYCADRGCNVGCSVMWVLC